MKVQSRSIRIDTVYRESETMGQRNKSRSLHESSRKHPSSMSLDLDSQLHYGIKNDSLSYERERVKGKKRENIDTINITKAVNEKQGKVGVSLTSSKGSYHVGEK